MIKELKINIFYLSHDSVQCAQWHVDRHVVKMILESCQLLSTARRLIDGVPKIQRKLVPGSSPEKYRNIKRWVLENDPVVDKIIYQATHVNHPSAVWVRQSLENYTWLSNLTFALIDEYKYRYGKNHKCEIVALQLAQPPMNAFPCKGFTQPTCAMPDEYKIIGDSITSYRNYYRGAKARMASWKKRDVPHWFTK
jgi:hypothetical protein